MLCLPISSLKAGENKSELEINKSIEKTTKFLIENWYADKSIRKTNWFPPQVIVLDRGEKIYGGCGTRDNKISQEVLGSFYCSSFHTIVLDPTQLKEYYDVIGPSSIAYVLAHEFAHGIQHINSIKLEDPMHELQADCIAGRLIDKGKKNLNITRKGIFDMATLAYQIGGSKTHGTGAQRAFALSAGMGFSDFSCNSENLKKLAKNEVKDNLFKTWNTFELRGNSNKNINLDGSKYRKNILVLTGIEIIE